MNILLIGFVSFVLKKIPSFSVSVFEDYLDKLLTDPYEDLEDATWYEELKEHWLNSISDELLAEHLDDFKDLLSYHPDFLYPVLIEIRRQLLAEYKDPLETDLDTFQLTLTLKWKDGKQVDYTCRPMFQQPPEWSSPMFIHVVDRLLQGVLEFCLDPGIDRAYSGTASEFDRSAFNTLTQLMWDHINSLAPSERKKYSTIVRRILQQYNELPPQFEVINPEGESLPQSDGGGGFK